MISNKTKKSKKKPNTEAVKNEKNTQNINAEQAEIAQLKQKYEGIVVAEIKKFKDFPLSKKTLNGLRDSDYKVPTEIQKEAITRALQGKDVLGAAVTGSGKTLAFLIPIIENLFTKQWCRFDGLGAIIISPTRELAYQIFETLRKVGRHHELSAALVIGGKNLKFETKRMNQCNIIIATPGRLLQHMDENPLFNCDAMQILVLDEADRILDMGFEQTMNAIIENLPIDRQTLLFSATQTKSVKDLARLSLKSPVYIEPKSQSATVMPANLNQNYVVLEQEEKITMIWSFIKNHLKQKIIVFVASCKQAKFLTEIFTKLRVGSKILGLYGTLHQDRRVAIYDEFVRKSNCVLICTDIASRGLDFPVVGWVVQLDCPEDAVAYIHRAGRTARYTDKGENLLVVTPSEEEGMVKALEEKKISVNKIFIDSKKLFSPRVKIEGILAQNMELKATAQRAFVAYLKSIYLMKNKDVFDVHSVDIDKFAQSLGLVVTPRVRFLERRLKAKSNQNGKNDNQNTFNAFKSDSEDESDDDFLKIKRKDHQIEDTTDDVADLNLDQAEEEEESEQNEVGPKSKNVKPITKAQIAKKLAKKKISSNRKIQFDESGNEVLDPTKALQSDVAKKLIEKYDDGQIGGIDLEESKALLKEEDHFDKQRFKELVKLRRREQKNKLKQKRKADEEEQDDFGSGDEDEEYTLLPDPNYNYSSDHDSGTDSGSDEPDSPKPRAPPKSNRKPTFEPPHKKKKIIDTSTLTLDEAELFAMKLLENK